MRKWSIFSPHLLRLTFLSFHLQPRDAPDHRFNYHSSVIGDFQASPFSCRLAANTPPNRVRHPADRQFASSCSPPRLTTTQLLSATELWYTLTRTYTVLIWRHRGRTTEPLRGRRSPPLFVNFISLRCISHIVKKYFITIISLVD